ncbi:MAG: damage-inducible protein DinB [Candidatus Eisenbacteria bacterium]|uniref:Damage-inducible protein DinB n=1 Tax=Eiseniibacteriota bacterium TaxID=2212470 RepID=A0A9D6QJJ6_UNCEI|nr:damage-inducible protein DinB [Candidatus Eisenbacteria bacterium]MBI3539330.1 damage-inducible protein DinB [Candidatus Eisenbacteria bacterium]
MSIRDTLLPEFDQEMASTRRVLERVPTDKGTWKPHVKSFALGHLAQLLSNMPGWITNTLTATELDLGGFPGYSFEPTPRLLEAFDKNAREARTAIAASKDADYDVMWSLTNKGRVFMSMPRGVMVRQTISHLSHHRGQMTVYLRLLDIPVPMIYGPTADERMG